MGNNTLNMSPLRYDSSVKKWDGVMGGSRFKSRYGKKKEKKIHPPKRKKKHIIHVTSNISI